MRIEALSKTLVFFDMLAVFQVIPPATMTLLEDKPAMLFTTQVGLQTALSELAINPTDVDCKDAVRICEKSVETAEQNLEGISIEISDLFKSFKIKDEKTV